MDVPQKLLNYKYHLAWTTLLSSLLALLLLYFPSALTVVSYFWPLLLSTAFFLAAVLVFGQISPPEPEACLERTRSQLMDYVAGHPDDSKFAGDSPLEHFNDSPDLLPSETE